MRLVKKLPDGRYIFEKEGVYFAVKHEQIIEMILLVIEHEVDHGNTAT